MTLSTLSGAIEECFERPIDQAALSDFDAKFRPVALAILLSMYSEEPTLAEDAYQTAFVKFLEIFRRGRRAEINYEAYFVAVAKHCLIDELRGRSRHVAIDELLEDPQCPEEIQRMEMRISLLQAMLKLPRRCQFVLEAYYVRSMKTEEIAKRLSIQPGSFHMALLRCREALKKILSGG